jgi:hypothetical protein
MSLALIQLGEVTKVTQRREIVGFDPFGGKFE